MHPKVSVLLPIYNVAPFLKDSIDSVLQQTFRDYEFLIIDDGSTDNSRQVLENYCDPRIRVIHNEENLGLAASLNAGILLAQGELLARMDGDDICFPDRFSRQVAFLENHPEVFILGTNTIRIDKSGEFIDESNYPISDAQIRYRLFFDNAIAHPTVMMRSDIFKKYNYFYENLTSGQDFDLWTRIPAKFKFGNLPERLYYHRRHSGSITSTKDTKSVGAALQSKNLYIQQFTGTRLTMDQLIAIPTPFQFKNTKDARIVSLTLLKFAMNALHWCKNSDDKKYIHKETSKFLIRVWGSNRTDPRLFTNLVAAIILDPGLLVNKFHKSTKTYS